MDTKHRVQNFWKYFMGVKGEVEQALTSQKQDDIQELVREINLQIESVCEAKAELEYHDGFYELILHGGANKSKQYICALLKKDAPKELIENWIISSFRQPLSETALHTVMEVEGETYQGADFTVYYEFDEAAKCIHIKLYSEAWRSVEMKQREQIALAMLELYIGEVELEARIGDLEIIEEPEVEAENFCLLPNFYEDICDIVMDEGWSDYLEPCDIYSAFKLDQAIVSETLRKDMKMIITTNALLQEELLNHESDSCDEAKRFGSEYGYLYYEVTQEKEKIALVRQQLEKELQELFYPLSIARTIGGAIGTHYGYVDMIIFDKTAFELLLDKLNEHTPFPIYYQSFQG